MRHRSGIVVVAASAALLVAGQASAKEVLYPAAHPLVRMNVPDDWSVAETPLGLELQAPQGDALVLAGTVTADKKSLDDWSRRALARMRQAGVSFAKSGPAVPAATAAKRATAAKGAAAAKGDAAVTRFMGTMAGAGGRPYTFSGLPAVDSPVGAAENKTVDTLGPQTSDMDLPTISTIDPHAATTSAMRATGHYAYAGGKLNGQPVDVELATFPIDKQTRLLVEQESGPTDARGVMIVRSLKAVPAAGK